MRNRTYLQLVLTICLITMSFNYSFSQSICDAIGKAQTLNTQMQWVYSYADVKNPNWKTAFKPILTEMQRVFPQPPKGIFYA